MAAVRESVVAAEKQRSGGTDHHPEAEDRRFQAAYPLATIHAPTQLAAKFFAVTREMLAKEIDGTAFRLMGAGVSALRPGSLADDTDMLDRRSAHAERAIDGLRKKFGNAAVIRGIAYDGPEKAEE